ncbi:hypothetical protein BC830DRAFT_1165385 [Chytriomyces sp. MP71]|nr:hypothetical protein BC830DRAFT_1165385 [Chytriomyces sp. MP71]
MESGPRRTTRRGAGQRGSGAITTPDSGSQRGRRGAKGGLGALGEVNAGCLTGDLLAGVSLVAASSSLSDEGAEADNEDCSASEAGGCGEGGGDGMGGGMVALPLSHIHTHSNDIYRPLISSDSNAENVSRGGLVTSEVPSSAQRRYSLRTRSRTPHARSTAGTPTSKRKWIQENDDAAQPKLRKRVLRVKPDKHNDIIAQPLAQPASKDTTPIASKKINEFSVRSSRSSSRASNASKSSAASTAASNTSVKLVNNIPLPLASFPSNPKLTIAEPSSIDMTPKAVSKLVTSAFQRFGDSSKKPQIMNDSMDIFFNSPTAKTQERLNTASARKSHRPTSPSPAARKYKSFTASIDTSDSSDSEALTLHGAGSLGGLCGTAVQKNKSKGSSLILDSRTDSSTEASVSETGESSGPNTSRPAWMKTRKSGRQLFPNHQPSQQRVAMVPTEGVDKITKQLLLAGLQSPLRGPSFGGLASAGHVIGVGSRQLCSSGADFLSRLKEGCEGDDEEGFTSDDMLASTEESAYETGDENDVVVERWNNVAEAVGASCVSPEYGALLLVFKRMLAENCAFASGDVCKCSLVSPSWKNAAQAAIWNEPTFNAVSTMLKMHRVLFGEAQSERILDRPAKPQFGGLRGMLGIDVHPSPRKLLFPDNTLLDMGQPNYEAKNKHRDTALIPNPKLAKLVNSVSFSLSNPRDHRFPPTFDVQAFITDTFPNLTSLCLMGTPDWVNPYLLSSIVKNSRLRTNLSTLELYSHAMDRFLTDPNPDVMDCVLQFLGKLKGLKRLVVHESTRLDDHGLKAISEGSSGLEVLSLQSCSNVTSTGVCWIIERCKELTALEVASCPQVGDEFFRSLVGAGGGALKSLVLSNLAEIQEEESVLGLLAPLCSASGLELKGLCVARMSGLTEEGVRKIVARQPALESFRVVKCDQVSKDGLGDLSNVTVLS